MHSEGDDALRAEWGPGPECCGKDPHAEHGGKCRKRKGSEAQARLCGRTRVRDWRTWLMFAAGKDK